MTTQPAYTPQTAQRTRGIAFCGLSIALMAVSAWITVPLGPVPFTLQTFVIAFVLLTLSPGRALGAVAGYVALGAVGVPVFSAMRGGIGVLAGPTGGFIWGFIVGVAVAVLFLKAMGWYDGEPRESKRSAFVVPVIALVLFLLCTYLCGWLQLMAVAHMGPVAALLSAVIPFVPVDAAKLVAAVVVALSVRRAIPSLR